jgi:hypothetical protein
MNHIIESIKAVLHLDNEKNSHSNNSRQQLVECNYENNYYGDQQCQLKVIDE